MQTNSEAIYDLLGSSSDWEKTLVERLEYIKQNRALSSRSDEAELLARTLEHVVPDRSHAIAAYVLCFSLDNSQIQALQRGSELSIERSDFSTAARLNRVEYKQSGDPALLVREGIAWLDAGEPDRAVPPLLEALDHYPESEELRCALECARQEWPDVRAEISRLKLLASQAESGPDAARSLLQAARTMMMLNCNPGVLDKYLLTAFKADPEHTSTLGLLERRLAHLAYPDAFWAICEERVDNRTSALGAVEELRRMAMRLCTCQPYRYLGLQVIQQALDEAYESELTHIPGHLAMHTLLFEYCEEAQLTNEYLNLIDRGLELPLPRLDQLFLSLQGLVLTLNMDDELGARNYARMVQSLAPNHPLVGVALERGLIENRSSADISIGFAATSKKSSISSSSAGQEGGEVYEIIDDISRGWVAPKKSDETISDLEFPEAPDEVSSVNAPIPAAPSGAPEVLGAATRLSPSSIDALRSSAKQRNQTNASHAPRAARLMMPLAIDVLVEGKEARALTRDLSETGAFILASENLPVGEEVLINVHLPAERGSLQTKVFCLETKVTRSIGSGYGVEFASPPEIFLTHFRGLLE